MNDDFDVEEFFDYYRFNFEDPPELKKTYNNFNQFLKDKFSDIDLCHEIEASSNICCSAAQQSGFEQGFCFAVKLMKALYKI